MSTAKTSVFDTMIHDILNAPLGSQMLDECMSFHTRIMKKVPLRYRLIALGFAKKWSLAELNEKLSQENCPQLYSRSLWEASLIFAFLHRLSYDEWKELQNICGSIMEESNSELDYFSKEISLREIKRYLTDNSSDDSHILHTEHLTRVMDFKISQLEGAQEDFRRFLDSNIHSFSPVREKARYYFCKYLYYYLVEKIEQFLARPEKSQASADALAELSIFKGVTRLKRKKMSPDEIRDFLSESNISCREIFDSLNYFYFGYISLDWLEVLMEYYGNIEDLPGDQKTRLAESLRHYDPKMKKLSDEEILALKVKQMDEEETFLDNIYSLSGDNRGYQRNRAGENTVRQYVKGTLDLDRTTFICFLLFFAKSSTLPEEFRITSKRLDTILLECGFPKLIPENDFDDFILTYLSCKDPDDLLIEEVTRYAENEENFFFYNMYKNSKNYQKEYKKIMGVD